MSKTAATVGGTGAASPSAAASSPKTNGASGGDGNWSLINAFTIVLMFSAAVLLAAFLVNQQLTATVNVPSEATAPLESEYANASRFSSPQSGAQLMAWTRALSETVPAIQPDVSQWEPTDDPTAHSLYHYYASAADAATRTYSPMPPELAARLASGTTAGDLVQYFPNSGNCYYYQPPDSVASGYVGAAGSVQLAAFAGGWIQANLDSGVPPPLANAAKPGQTPLQVVQNALQARTLLHASASDRSYTVDMWTPPQNARLTPTFYPNCFLHLDAADPYAVRPVNRDTVAWNDSSPSALVLPNMARTSPAPFLIGRNDGQPNGVSATSTLAPVQAIDKSFTLFIVFAIGYTANAATAGASGTETPLLAAMRGCAASGTSPIGSYWFYVSDHQVMATTRSGATARSLGLPLLSNMLDTLPGSRHLIVVQATPNGLTATLDGASLLGATPTVNDTFPCYATINVTLFPPRIGNGTVASSSARPLAEVIGFTSVLSAADVATISDRLSTKWGIITGSSPMAHPMGSSVPLLVGNLRITSVSSDTITLAWDVISGSPSEYTLTSNVWGSLNPDGTLHNASVVPSRFITITSGGGSASLHVGHLQTQNDYFFQVTPAGGPPSTPLELRTGCYVILDNFTVSNVTAGSGFQLNWSVDSSFGVSPASFLIGVNTTGALARNGRLDAGFYQPQVTMTGAPNDVTAASMWFGANAGSLPIRGGTTLYMQLIPVSAPPASLQGPPSAVFVYTTT